ncbi:MAG: helix-turn-helix domain-containing protein [Rhizobiaceae bacterium]
MEKSATPSVIFEMMRSFVVLARTLNVTQTAEELMLTRQTIRRHISDLEGIKGKQLFEIQNRQYGLTEDGQSELIGAEALLQRLDSWLNKEYELVAGLPRIHFATEDNEFWAQRYPAIEAWNLAPPLIKSGLQQWGESGCELENRKLRKIRPYLVVYRQHGHDWICVEVGEKSSYSSWLGWKWAKSAVGISFHRDPICSSADDFMIEAYDSVARTGSIWYDHIHTKLARPQNGSEQPVNYQRLVMALSFPDGELAVASLVARTNNIQIQGLASDDMPLMSKEDLMEFDI